MATVFRLGCFITRWQTASRTGMGLVKVAPHLGHPHFLYDGARSRRCTGTSGDSPVGSLLRAFTRPDATEETEVHSTRGVELLQVVAHDSALCKNRTVVAFPLGEVGHRPARASVALGGPAVRSLVSDAQSPLQQKRFQRVGRCHVLEPPTTDRDPAAVYDVQAADESAPRS